jgi:hypothetical protein
MQPQRHQVTKIRYQAFSETTLGKKGPFRATSTLIVYIGVGCQVSALPLVKKNGQSNRNRNFWSSVPKSAVVGFRIAHSNRQNIGRVKCSEIQQSPEWAQSNLQNAKYP